MRREALLYFGGDTFQQNASTVFEAAAGLSKILSRHTLKFGYEHRRWYDNQYKSAGGADAFSFYTLGNATTQSIDTNEWTEQGQANAWGAFLMGYSGWSVLTGYTTRALNLNYHAAYLMDDFKVSSRLTLNLGLRGKWKPPRPIGMTVARPGTPTSPTYRLQPGFSFDGLSRQFFPTTGENDSAVDSRQRGDPNPGRPNG